MEFTRLLSLKNFEIVELKVEHENVLAENNEKWRTRLEEAVKRSREELENSFTDIIDQLTLSHAEELRKSEARRVKLEGQIQEKNAALETNKRALESLTNDCKQHLDILEGCKVPYLHQIMQLKGIVTTLEVSIECASQLDVRDGDGQDKDGNRQDKEFTEEVKICDDEGSVVEIRDDEGSADGVNICDDEECADGDNISDDEESTEWPQANAREVREVRLELDCALTEASEMKIKYDEAIADISCLKLENEKAATDACDLRLELEKAIEEVSKVNAECDLVSTEHAQQVKVIQQNASAQKEYEQREKVLQ